MTQNGNAYNWDDHAIATLRTLWEAGHSTAEIGRRIGASKNAVIGKVHRLALPPRRSPIIPRLADSDSWVLPDAACV